MRNPRSSHPCPSPLFQKRKRDPSSSEEDISWRTVSGQRLDRLLELLRSGLSSEIGQQSEAISRKAFIQKSKDQFCIGINAVTRTLERMPALGVSSNLKLETLKELQEGKITVPEETSDRVSIKNKSCLQVVLVAMDVHPRLLVGHLPSLAASRGVPLLAISGGHGTGSLKLGMVFQMHTAMAVGLKKGDTYLNKAMQQFMDVNGA